MRRVLRFMAWATVIGDTYLLLGLIAVRNMKREYLGLLPPYDQDWFRQLPVFALFFLIGWTGSLALGCLLNTSKHDKARGNKNNV